MIRSGSDRPAMDDLVAARLRPRSVLADAVELFVRAPVHERSEIRAFGDLVDGLLVDAGFDDRRRLAEQLAERSDTPPDLARRLAMDAAEIARPMILASPVLTANDLVQIMRKGPEHVRLVAQRLDLAPDIAAVLIDTNDARRPASEAPTAATATAAATPRAPSQATASAPRREATPPVAAATASPAAPPSPIAPPAPPAPARVTATTAPATVAAPTTVTTAPISATTASEPTPPAEAPMFRVPVRGEPPARSRLDTPTAPRLDAGHAFLALDAAGRWRAIQAAGSEAAVASTARRRWSVDPVRVGDALFAAAIAGDTPRFREELTSALGLEAGLVERLTSDPSGEPLAVVLLSLGIEERRTLSILLHRAGETASHARMQDLLALIERVGRRAAEHLVATWRGDGPARRGDVLRQTDPAERREGVGPSDRSGQGSAETRATTAPALGRRGA